MRDQSRSAWRPWSVLALAIGLAAGCAQTQKTVRSSDGSPLVPPRRQVPTDDGVRRVQATGGDLRTTPAATPSPGGGATPAEAARESRPAQEKDQTEPDAMEEDESEPDEGMDESESTEEGEEEAEEGEEEAEEEEEEAEEEEEEAEEEEEEAEEEEAPRLLMKALGIEESPVEVYGWIENSFTGNTNGRPPSGENFGVFTNHRANQWLGNQYYLVVENPLEQDDTVNFGFCIDNLFGHDWSYTKAYGMFDEAFNAPQDYFAGYDMPQLYGEVHLPILTAGGLDVRGGKFYSLGGYEGGRAVERPLLSVPYLYNYGQPFTHFGTYATLHWNDHLDLIAGTINGWDRWINENYNWGFTGGFEWTSPSGKTELAVITVQGPNQFPVNLPTNTTLLPYGVGPGNFNSPNDPNIGVGRNPFYPRSNRSYTTFVLSHAWSDKLTQVTEFDHGYEDDIPGLNGFVSQDAEWYGFANWFLYQWNDKLAGVWRSEVWRDDDGARTEFADTFYEMTLGAIYKPVPHLWIRPEARYDWAQFTTPYNDGTRGSQFTLAFDIILLY